MNKRLLKPFAIIALGLVLLVSNFRPVHFTPTPQQKASHMLLFYNSMGPYGTCTGTAIGPHALLTAEHCDEKNSAKAVGVDLSTHNYVIQRTIADGKDHLILLVDGPAFTNYIPAVKLLNVHPIGVNEKVYIWGNGEGAYPAVYHSGKVAYIAQAADISEIDAAQGAIWYTFPSIPGDSGSAIYGEDGRIVGLVTYGIDENGAHCIGFVLGFTSDQIMDAITFVPAANFHPTMSILDLLMSPIPPPDSSHK